MTYTQDYDQQYILRSVPNTIRNKIVLSRNVMPPEHLFFLEKYSNAFRHIQILDGQQFDDYITESE